jgi:histidinol-phosphate aminotransferase
LWGSEGFEMAGKGKNEAYNIRRRFIEGEASNFLLVEILNKLGKANNITALQVYKRLAKKRGVVVRSRGKEYKCLRYLRITVSTEAKVTRLLKEIDNIKNKVYDSQDKINKVREKRREREANGVVVYFSSIKLRINCVKVM